MGNSSEHNGTTLNRTELTGTELNRTEREFVICRFYGRDFSSQFLFFGIGCFYLLRGEKGLVGFHRRNLRFSSRQGNDFRDSVSVLSFFFLSSIAPTSNVT